MALTREVKLSSPITFGDEVIETLTLKPNGRMLRDFSLRTTPEGGFDFEIYKLAVIGFRMAGYTVTAEKIVDRMESLDDMRGVASAVMGFIMGMEPSPAGSTP